MEGSRSNASAAAQNGDARAREWLSKYLVDNCGESPVQIGAREILRDSDENLIGDKAESIRLQRLRSFANPNPLEEHLPDIDYDEDGFVRYEQIE